MYKEQFKVDKKKYKVVEQDDGNGNITIKVMERHSNCTLCKIKEKKSKMYIIQDRRFVKSLVAKHYFNTCYKVIMDIINNLRTRYNQNKWYVG